MDGLNHRVSAARRSLRLCTVFMLVCCGAGGVYGQSESPRAFAVVRADSLVFVYHTATLPLGHGVLLYRTANGVDSLLTETPLTGARSGDEFAQRVSPDVLATLADSTEADPQSTFLALRADAFTGYLATLLVPEVARAMGRLVVDIGAPVGQEVRYRFVVVDSRERPTGEEFTTTTRLVPARPAAPTDLAAQPMAEGTELAWTYPTDDDFVVQFHAYRLGAEGEAPQRLHGDVILRNTLETRFTIAFPSQDSVETYAVAAVDATGQESALSAPLRYVVQDVTPPALPDSLTASLSGGGRVLLTWTPGMEPDLRGYTLYRAENVNDTLLHKLNEVPLPPTTGAFVDTLATIGSTNVYRIQATDRSGNSSPLSPTAQVYVPDRTPPPAPTDVAAVFQDDGTVRVTWQGPEADEDVVYLVSHVRLGRIGEGYIKVHEGFLAEPSVVDMGVGGQGFEEGAIFRYAVVASDAAFNRSDTVYADVQIPDRTPPAPPTSLEVTPDAPGSVAVAWNASPSGDVVAYTLRRSADGGADSVLAQVDRRTRFLYDEAVELGRTYVYTVTATDSLGNEGRPATDTLVVRDTVPPRVVRNVRALAESSGVRLVWEPVVADDLAGYYVYRADLPTGVFERISAALVVDATWRGDGGAHWWYRVRAVDRFGNESAPSPPVRAATPAQ